VKRLKLSVMATVLGGLLIVGQSAFAASDLNGMMNMMNSSHGNGMDKMMEHMNSTAHKRMMEQHKRFME
jgi:hypothetical protein